MYVRVKEYPSIEVSKLYSILNVIRFREKNLSFDFMGGVIYYCVVFSCFPLCSLKHIDLTDYNGLLWQFVEYAGIVTLEILEESYVSLAVDVWCSILLLFTDQYIGMKIYILISFVYNYNCFVIITGSFRKRCIIALCHCLAHYVAAILIFILAEILVVGCTELHKGLGDTTTFETFKKYFENSYNIVLQFDTKFCGGYGICVKC